MTSDNRSQASPAIEFDNTYDYKYPSNAGYASTYGHHHARQPTKGHLSYTDRFEQDDREFINRRGSRKSRPLSIIGGGVDSSQRLVPEVHRHSQSQQLPRRSEYSDDYDATDANLHSYKREPPATAYQKRSSPDISEDKRQEDSRPHYIEADRRGIPPGARWTKIDRRLINPEALIAGNERFEARSDYVIVLRVMEKKDIEAYAAKTQEIRDARREYYTRDKDKSRGRTHHCSGGEETFSGEEAQIDEETQQQVETPQAPGVQDHSLPERLRSTSIFAPTAERPSIKIKAEVNTDDQTDSMLEMGSVHASALFASTHRDLGSSSTGSMATDITSPDLEDDSIDSEIPGTKNMDHILNSAHYFSELERFELETARILSLKDGPYAALPYLSDCLKCFRNWQDALEYLQSQGFCGSVMSLLLETQDHNCIASAFHISLDEIESFISLLRRFMDPLDEQAILELMKELIQQILKVQDGAFAGIDFMESVRILYTILSIGLISFSGSHVCRFDEKLWDQRMEEIPIGFNGYAFKPRKLACLDDFIGGPAWVLSKSRTPAEILEQPHQQNGGYDEVLQETQKGPDDELLKAWKEQQESSQVGMKVSFTVQDLQELWGPVSLVGGTEDEGLVIRTERGFIVPVPRKSQSSLYGIECHWTTETPDCLSKGRSDMQILFCNTSKILIGTSDKPEIGLAVNETCTSSIQLIQQQIAYRLQYPGTCKSRYISEGFDVQLVGGQYATVGISKKYKRLPSRTLKAMLIEDCLKPDTRLVPVLNLRVGLEVSACTGNAQRVTLWDALRLSQTGTQSTDNSSCCAHKVGDKNCIGSCWTRWQSDDEIDSLGGIPGSNKYLSGAEARRIIINSILALEHSGVDSDENLQVCWPFSNSPVNCPLSPSSPKESHHWFRVVKDSRDTSSFAVFSQRCLEFPEQGLVRQCSAPCKEGHFKPLQTILATRILITTEERSVFGLPQGAKFVVGEAHLTVTKAVQDTMAIIATVSMNPLNSLRYRLREILPDARAFDFKEHIRPDITTDLSLPVFAY
ncbi:hypothetical protein N7451_010521 [Penicillium sp. IBT 35674x]|nr:hypothetical protein N7451_010521 [Penicillium sp. IBT 35674x]